MAWIWDSPPEKQTPVWAEYDHGKSTFQSYLTLIGQRQPEDAGEAILRLTGGGLKKVEHFHCLPNSAGGNIIIDDLLQRIILRHASSDEVQFYPVIIKGKDGETDRYSFVIPLVHLPCIDLENSRVKLNEHLSEPRVRFFGSLVHLPGCLGDHAIARDSLYPSHTLVSDALKDELAATRDKGLAFYQPEEMVDRFWRESMTRAQ